MAKKKTTRRSTSTGGSRKRTTSQRGSSKGSGASPRAGRSPNAGRSKSAMGTRVKPGSEKATAAGSGVKKSKPRKTAAKKDDGRMRLQRFMASAGVASRRECEIIIQEGRVEVDGQVVVELGYRVHPEKQEVYVDAERVRIEPLQYYVLNKPPGIVSTSQDPSGRPRVIDLIQTKQRVYNVGRLDRSSEGLILVTNDGTLAHRLTHPRYGVEKKYHVQVDGRPTPGQLRQLQDGIYIAEGKVRASNIKYLKRAKIGSWLEIVLAEGRNREIRRMLAAIGHKVRVLKRVSIGPLKLGELPVGAHRPLTPQELKKLQAATAGGPVARRKSTRKSVGRAKGAAEIRAESAGSSGGKSGGGRKRGSNAAVGRAGGGSSHGPVKPRGSRRHKKSTGKPVKRGKRR